ncbi:MAG: hypothetical protein ACR2PU_05235, partial [Gammaproteobacteria bacterium]
AQTLAAPIKSRVLHFLIRLQLAANLGSAGQRFRVEYSCQADNKSKPPDSKKIQILYWARLLSMGHSKFNATTTEPMPRLTNMIGNAQHTKVPDEANSANVLKNKEFLPDSINYRPTCAAINFILGRKKSLGSNFNTYYYIAPFLTSQ